MVDRSVRGRKVPSMGYFDPNIGVSSLENVALPHVGTVIRRSTKFGRSKLCYCFGKHSYSKSTVFYWYIETPPKGGVKRSQEMQTFCRLEILLYAHILCRAKIIFIAELPESLILYYTRRMQDIVWGKPELTVSVCYTWCLIFPSLASLSTVDSTAGLVLLSVLP